ncbi:hypothetical protein BO86DRAFT_90459 [Aspergillus japonicus CBS 114.51]|uniref:Uncharacterized protein n=1 Tax=Aspergillus japonicus CBS 114.51 TaxID=1448312 RepID=A0A8T8X1E3_ASPJA|nr:hypothetical protein BO86DRAFT_90459 [Aspergillus japonicus CBS 114.51]RAH81885.1 hypothetical protein BO86DRAFT_90459 [Aspergillus japonicus CBS 114.51]
MAWPPSYLPGTVQYLLFLKATHPRPALPDFTPRSKHPASTEYEKKPRLWQFQVSRNPKHHNTPSNLPLAPLMNTYSQPAIATSTLTQTFCNVQAYKTTPLILSQVPRKRYKFRKEWPALTTWQLISFSFSHNSDFRSSSLLPSVLPRDKRSDGLKSNFYVWEAWQRNFGLCGIGVGVREDGQDGRMDGWLEEGRIGPPLPSFVGDFSHLVYSV